MAAVGGRRGARCHDFPCNSERSASGIGSGRVGAAEARRVQAGGGGEHRRPVRPRAADGRLGLQLRRDRLPGVRDAALPDRHPGARRLHGSTRRRRHSDGMDGALRVRQTSHCAGLRRRWHSAGVAEARRGVSRADHRRRSRARRGSQLGHAAQHRRRARRQAHHAAREASWHARAVARRRRGTARDQGVLRARGTLQRRRRRPLQPRRHQSLDELGRQRRQRPRLGRVHCSKAKPPTAATRRGAGAARWTRWS